jgi:hypothetical protein
MIMKHPAAFVELLSRDTGLSLKDAEAGLNDLIEAGLLKRDRRGQYFAVLPKDEPPADQAEGSISSAAPIGNDASQGSQDVE